MARSRVSGVRETAKNIRRLSKSMATPIAVASRFALQPIQKDAKANLRTFKPTRYEPGPNVVTRELVNSLVIRQTKKTRSDVQHVVAPSGKGVRKAHLVEFGTDPHYQPKRKVMHPGAQPFPFLTPAFHKNDSLVLQRFEQRVGDEIERKARALGGRVIR